MAAARAWLVCAALALCACSIHAHVHGALRLAAVAGAAPDATSTSKATGTRLTNQTSVVLQHDSSGRTCARIHPPRQFGWAPLFTVSNLSRWQTCSDTHSEPVLPVFRSQDRVRMTALQPGPSHWGQAAFACARQLLHGHRCPDGRLEHHAARRQGQRRADAQPPPGADRCVATLTRDKELWYSQQPVFDWLVNTMV